MDAKQKLNEVNRIMAETGKDNSKFQNAFFGFMSATMDNSVLDQKTKNLLHYHSAWQQDVNGAYLIMLTMQLRPVQPGRS